MKQRLFAIGFIATFIFLLLQCMKIDKSTVGQQFFEWENTGTETDTVFFAAASDTFYHTSVPTGASIFLYAGEHMGNRTRSLIRFSLEPDTGTVDSVSMTLSIRRIIGTPGPLLMPTVYKINNEWEESTVTWETFETEGLLGEQIDAQEIIANTDSVVFSIPFDLVQSWIDTATADENHGLLIEYAAPDTGFIIEFLSMDAVSDTGNVNPTLTYRVRYDTTETAYSENSTQDAFIATTQQGGTSDYLYIADGTALRSLLYFDLNSIPDNITINSASLKLYADTTRSFPEDSLSFPITLFITTEESWNIPFVSYDSTASISGILEGDSTDIELQFFVQNWVTGTKENQGLILMGAYEEFDLSKRAFYSSNHPLKRPKLELIYTIPASGKYEEN